MNLNQLNDFNYPESKQELESLHKFFDIVNVMLFLMDEQGKVTAVNSYACNLFGLNKEMFIGTCFFTEIVRLDEPIEQIKKFVQQDRNELKGVRIRYTKKNTPDLIIELQLTKLFNRKGKLGAILISGKDVSSYVQSQNELQKDVKLYQILAGNIPRINLFLFDTEMRLNLVEGNENRNYSIDISDFENKKLSEIPDEELKQIWTPVFESALQGNEILTEYKYKGNYYLIRVFPLRDKEARVYSGIAITQDVTDEKKTGQKLRESKNEAERANQAKSEFLAHISHEIRTPLNAILGFTEQLLHTQLSPKQAAYASIIDKSSEHLLSLINDILVLSKIEAKQVTFNDAPFLLENTVRFVYDSLKAKVDGKGIKFRYDIDKGLNKIILGDSLRLRQILMNMISNAIKFTNEGYIDLRVMLLEENTQEVKIRFDVIDTGIGIAPDKLETIFEEFKQGDSTVTKKYGGTGLGLTICKNLIELQDGELKVSSREGVGSTFSFSLSYRLTKQKYLMEDDYSTINKNKLKDIRILLVDDDEVNLLLAQNILEKFPCTYDKADGGQKAIDLLKAHKYDVVLLDIHMPDVSGIDVARFIRFTTKDTHTKIVAVTAAALKKDIELYKSSGIDNYILKPFKEIHLYQKVVHVLGLMSENDKPLERKAQIIVSDNFKEKMYDLSDLNKIADGNPAFIQMALRTFVENTKEAMGVMRKALDKGDFQQIGETAHKILPSYRHLKINSVIEQLTAIKLDALEKFNYKHVAEKTPSLLEALKEVVAQVAAEY